MKDIAEEDYIYSLEQAEKHENNEYRIWASNIRKNDYMAFSLSSTLDYWRYLFDKEKEAKKG
ncbi:hypothetical protein RO3G_05572 [Rhizopus delemar RA 99-880]|uniref:Uncharacterized protein n=1 Tax=Rhizopus delemar (strain RA 99-880 / ATCC MYA-4621 / FGSC 9543 / NRRL 43880) TaxID=246409 RepID=I1BXD7_RHIO9|nr:hypothetical protein RO3G_05572 [Rhizopus delemar RA 99-880]|eukprot:EIE80867.1 hypothetical protein RO3G_05572 [Rhizopus delemar RA 99-880]